MLVEPLRLLCLVAGLIRSGVGRIGVEFNESNNRRAGQRFPDLKLLSYSYRLLHMREESYRSISSDLSKRDEIDLLLVNRFLWTKPTRYEKQMKRARRRGLRTTLEAIDVLIR